MRVTIVLEVDDNTTMGDVVDALASWQLVHRIKQIGKGDAIARMESARRQVRMLTEVLHAHLETPAQ